MTKKIPVSLDPHAPNTNFILGAALTGGDPMEAAKMLLQNKPVEPVPDENEEFVIMYDADLKKPGCVLLQAIGGTVPKELFYEHFGDSACWLVHKTPGLKSYPITRKQLRELAAKTDFGR